VRDAYVQVSAFVATTAVAFGLLQYYTRGALVERLQEHERLQPLVGALLGLTPGCGGAIVEPRARPPGSALRLRLAFLSAILTGYAIDRWGMGVGRDERRHDRVGSRDLQEPRLEHARG
jgi:hypothetical protein